MNQSTRSEALEFAAVLCLSCVSLRALHLQIFSPHAEVRLASEAVNIPYLAGLAYLIWRLTKPEKSSVVFISDKSWITRRLGEVVLGLLICVTAWTVNRAIQGFAPSLPQAFISHKDSYYRSVVASPLGMMMNILFTLVSVTYEEIVFRGYFLSKFQKWMGGTALPVFLSSLLFALKHGYPLTGTMIVFGSGLIFGYAYVYSKNLRAVIIGHFLIDFLVLGSHLGT